MQLQVTVKRVKSSFLGMLINLELACTNELQLEVNVALKTRLHST